MAKTNKISEEEINKFFTELLGGCWHEWDDPFDDGWLSKFDQCIKCEKYRDEALAETIGFFTWKGFKILWEWAISQENFLRWWRANLVRNNYGHDLVNPEVFARTLYKSLINKGGKK